MYLEQLCNPKHEKGYMTTLQTADNQIYENMLFKIFI